MQPGRSRFDRTASSGYFHECGRAIDFDETDAVTLTDVDTNDGTITVDAGGVLIVTDVATGNNNAIALTTSSGDITGLAS